MSYTEQATERLKGYVKELGNLNEDLIISAFTKFGAFAGENFAKFLLRVFIPLSIILGKKAYLLGVKARAYVKEQQLLGEGKFNKQVKDLFSPEPKKLEAE